MSTRMYLFITPKRVYASYCKTIMFDSPIPIDEFEKDAVMQAAKATICGYAMTFGSVSINAHETDEEWTPKEVFEFLEKRG
jgi:hypothetical protein